MSIIYTSESIYSGFLPHGTTASSIFGASSEASERPYHLNEPTSPSLINFLGRGRTKGGSGRDIYDRTDSMDVDNMVATSIAHKKHEDGRCEELWRAFRDDAGLWMAHRFDWDAWNDEEEKEDQDDLPDSFNGILTKAIIAPNLSKLEASPIYQNYAYTKCVLTKKKLNNIDLLQTYQYLQYLDLSFNKLTTLKPLGMLPFLKHLDASRNFLTTILDFKPPFFLTSVNLSRNKIKKIRDLSDFWSLTDLNLSHNMIKVIEGLKGLRYLSYLNLAFNNIETLENLSGLRVQFLFLQSNAIKIEEDDVKAQLDTLKNIRNVNLSYNQVSSLKIFEKVENLECLDIVNNNISKLLDIYYLRNLKYLNKLNLTGNPVTTLERYVEVCVTHIKNLIHLDNQKIDINLWMEKISNQNKDMHQIAAQHRLKLTVLEQLKPPEIWTWLSPYDEPPITVIVLVGLQASRRTYIVKKFCESNKKVVIGIPHSTRPKPVDENDGEYCYYIDESTFMTMLKNGEFLAYQEVLGTYLGIAHSEMKKAKNAILMLSTDLVMALTIKRHFLNTIFVLAVPSSREAHLRNMNIVYAIEVFENGTIRILNSPGMGPQLQADFEKRRDTDNWSQAKAFLESIVKEACDTDNPEDVGESVIPSLESNDSTAADSFSESRKSEKSEIVQMWISATQPEFPLTGSVLIHPTATTKSDSYFPDQPDVSKVEDDSTQAQAKRLVSFTVVHIHKVYDDSDTGKKSSVFQTEIPKDSFEKAVQDNLTEKGPQTKPSPTKSLPLETPTDTKRSSTCNTCPLSARYVFTGNQCYAELQSDDPRIEFLFDEEHRKREELLELYLDMPGLFRELLFTDHEEITMKKLQNLVQDISRFNETTKREVLSFEHDDTFNGVIKDRTINLFQDIENAKMTSGQQAAKYTPTVYTHRCQYGRCDNPTCIQWSNV